MRNRRPVARRAVGVALALATIAGSSFPGVVLSVEHAPAATCTDGWLPTDPSGLLGSTAVDVTYLNGRPWVAGSAVLEARRPSAFTASAAGDAWASVDLAPTSGSSVLTAVATNGPNRLWAAGEVVGALTQPLIQHWDGKRWFRDAVPLQRHGGALTDIEQLRGGAALAVGYAADLQGQHPLALRWNGVSWRPASPVVGDRGSLMALSSAPDGTTWAVGWVDTVAGLRPLLERWTGSGWRRDTMRGTGIAALAGVAVDSATDAWAVGYRERNGMLDALAVHWDGQIWAVDDGLAVATSGGSLLRDVAMVAGEPIAVGAAWDDQSDDTDPLIAQRQGESWDTARGVGGISGGELIGVASAPRLIVVGRADDHAVAMTPCEQGHAPSVSDARVAAPDQAWAAANAAAQGPDAGTQGPGAGTTTAPPQAAESVRGLQIRDVTEAAGLSQTTLTYTGNAADFNDDGWPDLVIGRHGRPLWVLQNTGTGTFVPPFAGGFRRADRHGCSVGDLDGDGLPDIACAVGANLGLSVKENEVWLDPFDPAGINQASGLGVSDPLGRGRRTAIFDANHDGRLDLYVANDPSRADGLPSTNRLFLNTGDGFISARQAGLDLGIGGNCLVAADIDGDGWTDLVACAYIQMAGFTGLRIFHNDHGRFTDVTQRMGLAAEGDVAAGVADLNADGRPDLVRMTTRHLEVDLQRNGAFTPGYDLDVSQAQAVTLADVNGDGAPDIYVVRGVRGGTTQDLLLLNDGSGRRFTSVALPPAQPGVGGGAVAIDYDRNGRQDLLIMHGNNIEPGPIQLLAFGPPWPFAGSPAPTPGLSPVPSAMPSASVSPPPAASPIPSAGVRPSRSPGASREPSPSSSIPSAGATAGPASSPISQVVPRVVPSPAPSSSPPAGAGSDSRRLDSMLTGGAMMLGALAALAVLMRLLQDRRRRLRGS